MTFTYKHVSAFNNSLNGFFMIAMSQILYAFIKFIQVINCNST